MFVLINVIWDRWGKQEVEWGMRKVWNLDQLWAYDRWWLQGRCWNYVMWMFYFEIRWMILNLMCIGGVFFWWIFFFWKYGERVASTIPRRSDRFIGRTFIVFLQYELKIDGRLHKLKEDVSVQDSKHHDTLVEVSLLHGSSFWNIQALYGILIVLNK